MMRLICPFLSSPDSCWIASWFRCLAMSTQVPARVSLLVSFVS